MSLLPAVLVGGFFMLVLSERRPGFPSSTSADMPGAASLVSMEQHTAKAAKVWECRVTLTKEEFKMSEGCEGPLEDASPPPRRDRLPFGDRPVVVARAFAGDRGLRLVVAASDAIRVVDVASGDTTWENTTFNGVIKDVQVFPELGSQAVDRVAALVVHGEDGGGSIFVWDANTGHEAQRLPARNAADAWRFGVLPSRAEFRLAGVAEPDDGPPEEGMAQRGYVDIWDAATGSPQPEDPDYGVEDIDEIRGVYFLDGRMVAFITQGGPKSGEDGSLDFLHSDGKLVPANSEAPDDSGTPEHLSFVWLRWRSDEDVVQKPTVEFSPYTREDGTIGICMVWCIEYPGTGSSVAAWDVDTGRKLFDKYIDDQKAGNRLCAVAMDSPGSRTGAGAEPPSVGQQRKRPAEADEQTQRSVRPHRE